MKRLQKIAKKEPQGPIPQQPGPVLPKNEEAYGTVYKVPILPLKKKYGDWLGSSTGQMAGGTILRKGNRRWTEGLKKSLSRAKSMSQAYQQAMDTSKAVKSTKFRRKPQPVVGQGEGYDVKTIPAGAEVIKGEPTVTPESKPISKKKSYKKINKIKQTGETKPSTEKGIVADKKKHYGQKATAYPTGGSIWNQPDVSGKMTKYPYGVPPKTTGKPSSASGSMGAAEGKPGKGSSDGGVLFGDWGMDQKSYKGATPRSKVKSGELAFQHQPKGLPSREGEKAIKAPKSGMNKQASCGSAPAKVKKLKKIVRKK